MSDPVQTFTKAPADVLDYVLNWGGWLSDGDYIVDSTWAITSDAPDDELVVSPTILPDFTETATRVWLEGGTHATLYHVSNTITSFEGLVDTQFFDVIVQDSGTVDLDASQLCEVTARFYTADGDGVEGVYVRFSPTRTAEAFTSTGIFSNDTTAESDATGRLRMFLARGLEGMLTITGVGIVRQVTVPDVASITLEDLVAIGDDLLEVQTPQFTKLPRRS
jgi:hypothetical protein